MTEKEKLELIDFMDETKLKMWEIEELAYHIRRAQEIVFLAEKRK